MNAVDTNVLIYRLDWDEPAKRRKARELLRNLLAGSPPTCLLWQVAGEFVRQMRRWQDQKRITRAVGLRYINTYRKWFPLIMPTPQVLDHALDLSGRYSLSHWDSMLLGACKAAGVDVLYTEDMGAPVTIDGIQLMNPFV